MLYKYVIIYVIAKYVLRHLKFVIWYNYVIIICYM